MSCFHKMSGILLSVIFRTWNVVPRGIRTIAESDRNTDILNSLTSTTPGLQDVTEEHPLC
jgi:hypothetical protein